MGPGIGMIRIASRRMGSGGVCFIGSALREGKGDVVRWFGGLA